MTSRFLSFSLLAGTMFFGASQAECQQLENKGNDTVKTDKVLILGNSITKHAPKADIGWTTDWGMAASTLEKDYSHLLLSKLAGVRNGKTPESRIGNIAVFEREYATCDVKTVLKPYLGFSPDILILAIGENIPEPKTPEDKEKLHKSLGVLVGLLKQDGNPAIFIRSSFFANKTKDDILRQVCAECGGTFIDISALCKTEANFARAEKGFDNKFVGSHPGDTGMAAIADAIWKVVSEKIQKPL
jgi:hypothetical protein